MTARRIVLGLLAGLTLATGAASAGARTTAGAPNGLRAFLLRADESAATTFSRTPSFAWSPYPGAASYEFQLSTSSAFRDNGIVWQCPSASCPSLASPVAAPSLSLPWITGEPHGLYARVRAVMPDRTKTDWSDALGIDVQPPTPPTPLPSRPGLLRWTPTPGATGYQVWLVDAHNKVETTYTNVLDEREFYTFHTSPQWIGTVRWRVRAMRGDWNGKDRVNGIPIAQYGAWSPIYKSTNTTPPSGPIKLGSTISDVVTNGQSSDDAHRQMPGFTWTGNQGLTGVEAELFRVYVFTDRQCLNRVFTSSVVGSPAYAPRPYGGLALPFATATADARGAYLDDLVRQNDVTILGADGEKIVSSESQKSAAPTMTLPLTGDAAPGQAAAASTPFFGIDPATDFGAPVSLWDDDWPKSGYYWTVVPVGTRSVNGGSTTLAAAAPKGSTTVSVTTVPGFKQGDQVQVGSGAATEVLQVATVTGSAITFGAPTLNSHAAGEPVMRLGSGSAVYQDLETPQDACSAGRVARFGINSEPTLIAGDDPFASGLSPQGKLASALRTASFYKAPLVAWTPALGADAYQVQWSRQAVPFDPEPGPGGSAGILTGSTAYVLPLTTGTWYYRVRGYDWSLPTNAQAMGWSDVAKVVITKPTFKVVASVAVKKKR